MFSDKRKTEKGTVNPHPSTLLNASLIVQTLLYRSSSVVASVAGGIPQIGDVDEYPGNRILPRLQNGPICLSGIGSERYRPDQIYVSTARQFELFRNLREKIGIFYQVSYAVCMIFIESVAFTPLANSINVGFGNVGPDTP